MDKREPWMREPGERVLVNLETGNYPATVLDRAPGALAAKLYYEV